MHLFTFCRKSLLTLVAGASVWGTQFTQGATRTWDNGAATGAWNTTDANWTGANYANPDDVIFNGTAPGTINIPAVVSPNSMSVSGSSDYTFTGAGITGTPVLNKSGSGVLTLDNATNSFSAINLSGGEIVFDQLIAVAPINVNQLGTGPINVLDDAILTFTRPDTNGATISNQVNISTGKTITFRRAGSQPSPTWSGKITGTGNLVIDKPAGPGGNGWTFSNATNDFVGTISIVNAASTATFSNDGAMGGATSITIATGGSLQVGAGVTGVGKTLNVASATGSFNTGGGVWQGLVTGGSINSSNVGYNNAGNSMSAITFNGVAGGTLRIGVAGSVGTGSISYDSNGNNTIRFIDSVGGTFTNTINFSSGTRFLNVEQANAVINWTGNINATSTTNAITKDGPGTFVTTNWNVTNPLVVNAGTFRFNDTSTANLRNITVGTAGTLAGIGNLTMFAGESVTVNGTLAPGNSAGTLTINGPLNLSSTSILKFELGTPFVVGGGVNDLVQVNGNLILDGTLQVTDLGGLGGTGNVYRLFNYTGVLTDNGLILSGLGNGYLDTSIFGQVNLVFPIPEPATAWLIGLPLLLIGRKARRARR